MAKYLKKPYFQINNYYVKDKVDFMILIKIRHFRNQI